MSIQEPFIGSINVFLYGIKSTKVKFYYFSIATLFTIYLVIIAGGVVRMTGSGMGCPDWPKCFDQYIPPTSIDELPENYKEIYSNKRKEKISRFSKFLTSLGFEKKANEIVADKSLLVEQDFNVFNTWTEYINRLTGVLTGLFITLQLLIAALYFKKYKLVFVVGFILLLITVFQAWFGAMVVATNIVPWVLSIHMMLAIVMIFLQLVILYSIYSKQNHPKEDNTNKYNLLVVALAIFGIVLMIIQTYWGTQVRQQVDDLVKVIERSAVIDQLNVTYIFHRTLAILFLIIGAIMVFLNYKKGHHSKKVYAIGILIFVEAVIGKLFSLLDLASILQPTHLFLSMVLFGVFIAVILEQIYLKKEITTVKHD